MLSYSLIFVQQSPGKERSKSERRSEKYRRELSAKMLSMFDSFLSGAAFGAALAATGMYHPAVIISQMKLENWHMVQTFLTASGAST